MAKLSSLRAASLLAATIPSARAARRELHRPESYYASPRDYYYYYGKSGKSSKGGGKGSDASYWWSGWNEPWSGWNEPERPEEPRPPVPSEEVGLPTPMPSNAIGLLPDPNLVDVAMEGLLTAHQLVVPDSGSDDMLAVADAFEKTILSVLDDDFACRVRSVGGVPVRSDGRRLGERGSHPLSDVVFDCVVERPCPGCDDMGMLVLGAEVFERTFEVLDGAAESGELETVFCIYAGEAGAVSDSCDAKISGAEGTSLDVGRGESLRPPITPRPSGMPIIPSPISPGWVPTPYPVVIPTKQPAISIGSPSPTNLVVPTKQPVSETAPPPTPPPAVTGVPTAPSPAAVIIPTEEPAFGTPTPSNLAVPTEHPVRISLTPTPKPSSVMGDKGTGAPTTYSPTLRSYWPTRSSYLPTSWPPASSTEPTPAVTPPPSPASSTEPTPVVTPPPSPASSTEPTPVVTQPPSPASSTEPTPVVTQPPSPASSTEPTPVVVTPPPSPAPSLEPTPVVTQPPTPASSLEPTPVVTPPPSPASSLEPTPVVTPPSSPASPTEPTPVLPTVPPGTRPVPTPTPVSNATVTSQIPTVAPNGNGTLSPILVSVPTLPPVANGTGTMPPILVSGPTLMPISNVTSQIPTVAPNGNGTLSPILVSVPTLPPVANGTGTMPPILVSGPTLMPISNGTSVPSVAPNGTGTLSPILVSVPTLPPNFNVTSSLPPGNVPTPPPVVAVAGTPTPTIVNAAKPGESNTPTYLPSYLPSPSSMVASSRPTVVNASPTPTMASVSNPPVVNALPGNVLQFDGFESGDLNELEWSESGVPAWIVDETNPYEGSFSAHIRTEDIPNALDFSQLDLTVTLEEAGFIQFYFNAPVAMPFESLELWVDGSFQTPLATPDSNWAPGGVIIASGEHIVSWRYANNPGGAPDDIIGTVPKPPYWVGEAWLDNVALLPTTKSFLEDWESQDFTTNYWVLSGDADWTITETNAYDGTYSATVSSSDIAESYGYARLSIDIITETGGTLTYWMLPAVSQPFDVVNVLVGDVIQFSYSNVETDWVTQDIPIQAGKWTVTFELVKNQGQIPDTEISSIPTPDGHLGQVWLDAISFTTN